MTASNFTKINQNIPLLKTRALNRTGYYCSLKMSAIKQ